MVVFKNNGLSKNEETQIFGMLQELNDPFCDFYITKDNLRLFIKDNFDILKACLKKGDKLIFNDKGIAVVVGYSDKAPRKYVKILSKDLDNVPALVKSLYWNIKEDLFCKVKNNNPIKDTLMKSGFKFIGGRGKEVLLVHNYIARPEPTRTYSKDRDEDE